MFFVAAMMLSGCNSHSAPAETPRPAVVQWSGQHGGSGRPGTHVLQRTDEWNAFWERVKREAPRTFDPSRDMAVVIELGGRPTAGYNAQIISAGEREGKFVVQYRETAPDPGMLVAQVLTSPWAIAVVPRSALPVVFQRVSIEPRRQER